jgi:hypothetical protein
MERCLTEDGIAERSETPYVVSYNWMELDETRNPKVEARNESEDRISLGLEVRVGEGKNGGLGLRRNTMPPLTRLVRPLAGLDFYKYTAPS